MVIELPKKKKRKQSSPECSGNPFKTATAAEKLLAF